MLAGLIAEALVASPDFELVGGGIVALSEIEDRLQKEDRGIQALIVVGDINAAALDAILARHADVVVSHVAIGSEIVRINLADLDLNQLFGTLRLLAREPHAPDQALEYRLAPARGLMQQGWKLAPLNPARTELNAAALVWIDAALLCEYLSQPGASSDVAGRAREPTAIGEFLKSRGDRKFGDASRRASQAADATAAQFFEMLDAPAARGDALARLYRALALTRSEMKLVLLALATELDAKYQPVFGILEDDMGRRGPGFALACSVAGGATGLRAEITASGALTRWLLLVSGGLLPRADELLRLDERVLAWLMGDETALQFDGRLAGCTVSGPWTGAELLRRPSDLAISRRLLECLDDSHDRDWLVLAGADAHGWRAQLELAAQRLNRNLLRLSLGALAKLPGAECTDAAIRLARAARLMGSILVVDAAGVEKGCEPGGLLGRLADSLALLGQPAVLIAEEIQPFAAALRQSRVIYLEGEARDAPVIATAFLAASSDAGLSLTGEECERLGQAFPLPLDQIEDAVRLAVLDGAQAQPDDRHYELIAAKCRRIASPELPRFAQRITPAFTLDDVVLPSEWHSQLWEMVGHLKNAPKVMNAWGFAAQTTYGRGVAALFSGASGTGKTMAAQAIAHALKTEAFLVDLSRTVSKFIGESEKNLDVVFSDAERAGAVLVFDEADAIFGKRSEIKDAHDRYANIEVAYLLQRMETFSGVVILTTNFRQNLDQAFLRRLRFIVEFPKPDAAAREAIWRRCLPQAAPLAEDVDFAALGRRIELTGGNIRQITLRAAFAAAGEGASAIAMRHILGATKAELVKLGRASGVRELEEYEALRAKIVRRVA